jgi:hypothetical protein
MMRDEAANGLVVTHRYVDDRPEITAAYRSGPVGTGPSAVVDAQRVIEMIIEWQAAHDGAGHERPALGGAEAQRMADAVAPTHQRVSAVHFAARPAPLIKIHATSPHSGPPFETKAQVR